MLFLPTLLYLLMRSSISNFTGSVFWISMKKGLLAQLILEPRHDAALALGQVLRLDEEGHVLLDELHGQLPGHGAHVLRIRLELGAEVVGHLLEGGLVIPAQGGQQGAGTAPQR